MAARALGKRLISRSEARGRAARAVFSLLMACALLALPSQLVRAGESVRVPIVFHVAERDGAAVAADSFIADQLAAANSIYGPLGIELVQRERLPLPAKHAEMVTRADRDALARYVKKGAIHCFVVAKLMDVDEPGRERRGVHWRPRPNPRQSLLIVSKISMRYVLAHELGHYLGNQKHSQVPGNLMSYTRADGPPFLDAEQIQRVKVTLAALLKQGTLVPVTNR